MTVHGEMTGHIWCLYSDTLSLLVQSASQHSYQFGWNFNYSYFRHFRMNHADVFISLSPLMSYGNGGGGVATVDCSYLCHTEFLPSSCHSHSSRVSRYRIHAYSLGRGYTGHTEHLAIHKSTCCKGQCNQLDLFCNCYHIMMLLCTL